MKAEIIIIGDEILYGQTLDTNSAFIAEKLGELGVEISYKTAVGDEVKKIVEAIHLAQRRVDLVITTGGLGPTSDDLTVKGIAKAFKKNLIFHPEILKKIEARFKARGIEMPKINQNQALIPQGAKALENPLGSAPGILIEEDKKIFTALPGVPKEMKTMLEQEVIPLLKTKVGKTKIVHRKIRTTGIIESKLYEKIQDLLKDLKEIKVAFLPSYLGVDLRLTANLKTSSKSKDSIIQLEEKIKERIGEFIYGYDEQTLEEVVGKTLKENGKTLSVAESCTGGLVAAKITNISGSSDYFERGVVSYSNQSKIEILGVPQDLLEKYGTVSPEVALAMAKGIREISKTDLGLSVTGIAGPTGGTKEKPVGLIYIGLADAQNSWVEKFLFGQDRMINRERASQAALNMVRLYFLGKYK
ncbi:MAG TPA: competence/damage-inducible protein A [candidate division Zixibacteria bacterium]|nr:competence/damage-inducible protein A [candidate division Zixibacteria bacterium]